MEVPEYWEQPLRTRDLYSWATNEETIPILFEDLEI